MDERRSRILEDLKGILQGDVRADTLTLALYASDASLYQIPPLAVVYPRSRDDVCSLMGYAAEHRLPVIPRGAGTGLAGEALGQGIIVDFTRHMRFIEAVGEDWVRVQPGVVCSRLNEMLARYGRYFPPDPSGASVTTIGSMLALDAAGSHAVRIGSTRDHVRTLEVVLADGTWLELGTETATASTTTGAPPPTLSTDAVPAAGDDIASVSATSERSDSFKQRLVHRIRDLLTQNQHLITEWQKPLLRNRCGYFLRGVVDGERVNFPRMLVGSEGTLGLFTAATLFTAPRPGHRGVALILFQQMEAALKAVQHLIGLDPSACDLLDRRLLSLAREADPRFQKLVPADAEVALILEQTGDNPDEARDRLDRSVRIACADVSPLPTVHRAYRPEEIEFLWSLPERVVPLLARLPGPARPLPLIEDIAVAPETLGDFLNRARQVFQRYRVTTSLYAHAATGQLHIRPFLAPPVPQDAPMLEALARDLYAEVKLVGGTISGEHGTGLSRSAFVADQYGPLYDVFRQIKDLFDPHQLLNPQKVICADPHLTSQNLRPAPTSWETVSVSEPIELQLQWDRAEFSQAVHRCNGCGRCRTQETELRMCPLFRMDPVEEATPRAKANLMRHVNDGQLPVSALGTSEFKQIADLCFNCKQCEHECPSNVSISHFMIEAKAAFVAEHGLSGADWFLSRAHAMGPMGSATSLASNWIIQNPWARWVLERTLGVARHRKLPLFARQTFLKTAQLQRWTKPPRRLGGKAVAYFVDYFANFHDPELARAFVEILRMHRVPFFVPPDQQASGMAMISAGDLEPARELAEQNLRVLAEPAREGYAIVCTEPAAAVCLKHDYPMIASHPDRDLVASRVIDATAFLQQLLRDGTLTRPTHPVRLDVGYHTPCHTRTLQSVDAVPELLGLIPELRVHKIEEGCSGMAGTFGLSQKNFRNSVRIGWNLISRMRMGDLAAGTTECSSCKMQMEQGNETPTVHPIKLLALAYGLLPELANKLRPQTRPLVVS